MMCHQHWFKAWVTGLFLMLEWLIDQEKKKRKHEVTKENVWKIFRKSEDKLLRSVFFFLAYCKQNKIKGSLRLLSPKVPVASQFSLRSFSHVLHGSSTSFFFLTTSAAGNTSHLVPVVKLNWDPVGGGHGGVHSRLLKASMSHDTKSSRRSMCLHFCCCFLFVFLIK